MASALGFYRLGIAILALGLVTSCAPTPRAEPDFIVYSMAPVYHQNSLLDGGLDMAGLRNPSPPPIDENADKDHQRESLRTLAIHTNIRALLDTSDAGGFGRLYGPRTPEQIRVSGTEYLAAARIKGQKWPFAIAVLVPDSFAPQKPCMVVSPSSGSRGVYGAIGLTGPWAFAHQCALVLTDKTTGTALVALDDRVPYRLDGTRAIEKDASSEPPVLFNLEETKAIEAYASGHPRRIAFKHAHSQDNSEKDWGAVVLMAARYGDYVLRKEYGVTKRPRTLAASISNGGAAVLRAAELDQGGIIDGVVASEPNITPPNGPYPIAYANQKPVMGGRAFYDYLTLLNLYAPCAVLSPKLDNAPFIAITRYAPDGLKTRCRLLAKSGRLTAQSLDDQIAEALEVVDSAGLHKEAWPYLSIMSPAALWPSLSAAYAMAYSRAGVEEELCDLSFIAGPAFDGAKVAGLSSGIAPTMGITLSYDGLGKDQNFAAALCLRKLYEEKNPALMAGIAEIRANAKPGQRPIVILHGRNDGLILPEHASRAYMSAVLAAGPHPELRYYEIENAQHFDALTALPSMAGRIVPIQPYFETALDMVFARLAGGPPLPPSQWVHTKRRQGSDTAKVEPFSSQHLGPIALQPGKDAIEFADGILHVPE
ncbi:MAG: 3-hydroxybutyrate oligomer hydrolase family protein [Robiginitomaculum sp.]|nr:3-hydroxybutyrate oligomer hydrolase family protein [Robiginitomaculum sp.]MDQ7078404.1 3-hydroxybutyrate oligomer hydrolase family protein [Robiginitomaculum sp.]